MKSILSPIYRGGAAGITVCLPRPLIHNYKNAGTSMIFIRDWGEGSPGHWECTQGSKLANFHAQFLSPSNMKKKDFTPARGN
jgi:hypothetical protein